MYLPEFKSMPKFSLGVCLSTESRCSSRIQVDCKTSKEQAEVYYRTTTSLYIIKPHVKGKVKAWKTAYTCKCKGNWKLDLAKLAGGPKINIL